VTGKRKPEREQPKRGGETNGCRRRGERCAGTRAGTTSSAKKTPFLDVFDTFWDHVQRAEQDVWENGHRGPLPPICSGDPWDEEFAAAYEEIQPYLRRFKRDRFFPVPAGLPFRPRPIRAETAHQAIMFFLNKPDELYGDIKALDSPEYLAIKEEAKEELKQRDKSRRVPRRTKDLKCSISAKIRSELIELRGYLWEYHFPLNGDHVLKPLTIRELKAEFGWSQSTVTRRMQDFFHCNAAMAAYARLFHRETTKAGYIRRFEDRTLSIEAIMNGNLSRSDDEYPDSDE
jgi:hypothetical protein